MGNFRKINFIAAGVVAAITGLGTLPAYSADAIRIVSPYQTTTLDPMRSAAAGNIETYGQLYSRLLLRNPSTGAIEPGLAQSWDISADGLTYTTHLREAFFRTVRRLRLPTRCSARRIRSDKQSLSHPLGAVDLCRQPSQDSWSATSPRSRVPQQSRNLEHGHRVQADVSRV
jgi:peptide/nickel transport system substrate-binding protein